MNVVTPGTPTDDLQDMFRRDGYVLMSGALSTALREELSEAYEKQLLLVPPKEGALRVEAQRILERVDPVRRQLTGHYTWHHGDEHFSAGTHQAGGGQ